jgi:SAM-dependent methyltransferase
MINQSTVDADIRQAISHAILNNRERIGRNDALFLSRIFGDGIGKYVERVQAIGFANYECVLDAGCGFGQWSLALAQVNQSVSACDISSLRIDVVGEVAKELAVTNIDLCVCGIDSLPYAAASFDAVFCYGVIFLTPWRKTLSELTRVLKPGGTLYVNANGLGWYMFLWQEEHNMADDYDPKAVAARTLFDTLRYDREGHYEPGMNFLIEPLDLENELRQLGFTNIQTDHEGCLHLDANSPKAKPFFKGEYCGQVGVYEVVAKKL